MKVISPMLGLSLFASVALASQTTKDESELYGETLKAATASLNAKVDKKKLGEQMNELVKLSKVLITKYSERHVECKDYLNQTAAQADKLADMPLEKIEKDYHEDGALPKAPAICHHAKDLLVHPATVLAILKVKGEKGLNEAKAELVELNSHLAVVQATLKK